MPPIRHTTSKARNFKSTFIKMIKELKPLYVSIIIVMILSVGSSILSIIVPNILNSFLNLLTTTNSSGSFNGNDLINVSANGTISINWATAFYYCGLIIGLYILSALLSWLAEFISVKIATTYSYNIRDKLKKKLDKLPLSYFDKIPYGDTLSVGVNDVDNISRNLQNIITQTCSSFTLFFGVIIAMFITEWRLSFVTLASLPITLLIIIFIAKFSQKQFLSYRKELGKLNGQIEEDYSGFKIIKLFNKEEKTLEKFNNSNNKMAKSDGLSQFLSGFIYPSTNFINNLAFVGIAIVGGLINQPATMIVFFIYLNYFTRPFQQIGQIFSTIQSVVASGERIYDILEYNEETKDIEVETKKEDEIEGNYLFEGVNFSYSLDKPLIENMNLKVNKGDIIAIVGPTGAGKTTIVNLIMRFYDVNSGSIKIDGIDIKEYKRKSVRGIVGMVLQDTWLFKGTIKDNITYGNPTASKEEIIKACKEAHIYHFIQTLPNTFDFELNEEGTNISQGQRQLITIARAILSKPKVMILDEATSSVDTRTEKEIQDAMQTIMQGRTSFIIAHRLSTIKNAKLILVMKKGHIVESGNHKELIDKNGFYADLYNSQFVGALNNENIIQES